MRPNAFKRALGRLPQRTPYGRMTVAPLPALPPQALPHFWHPDRDGVEPCPPAFAAQLATVHRDLAICRPPGRAPITPCAWLVWYRKPSVTHWLSPGWILLFVWQERVETNGGETMAVRPLPLDSRIFANLYRISALQFGSAVAYFDSVVKTITDERAARDKQDKSNTDAKRREFFQSRKIKNIGAGNKFALHHDGSVVPSRGEANWAADRELCALPQEMADRLRDRRKQIASARKGPR